MLRLHAVKALPFFLLAVVACSGGPSNAAPSGDVAAGAALFKQRCALCHQASTENGQGPGLAGVVGRKAASATGFNYTRALRESGLTLDVAALDAFLAAPMSKVPGTTMVIAVPDATERKNVIAYLATLQAPVKKAEAPPAGSETGSISEDAPGRRHAVRFEKLPPPFDTPSAGNAPSTTARKDRVPRVADGFVVELVTDKLDKPRAMRTAPNGDIFVSETAEGRVSLIRDADGATPSVSVFADKLKGPFGVAFVPGFVYVANNDSVVRFAYADGDLKARGKPEVVVASLSPTTGGHTTRDIVFAPDGKRFFVSVGSASNVADGMAKKSASAAAEWDKQHGLGAAWDSEERRANVLWFSADGKQSGVYASGIRNCVGLALRGDTLWCSTNERDGLGDDLVPDYVTSVREGGFYGWPWYYLGAHEDPRRKAERPDLADKVTTPDVLLQAHSASLQMTFHEGSAYAALHGSWNRGHRTGYKVIRIVMDAAGKPTGDYEDAVTGFALAENDVWGRPVGLTVSKAGALIISEDAASTIWRVRKR